MPTPALPAHGVPAADLLEQLRSYAQGDVDYRAGRTWSLVYWVSEAHHAVCEQAFNRFMDANALNPLAFRSLKRMEHEVVQLTARLLNGGPATVGTMTSGGTESLLLAVQTWRDVARARRPWILRPNIVVPASAHPALDKACHYFGVRKKAAPLLDNGQVDVAAMARLIDRNTVLLVGSAPQYPWGTVDPIPALGALAQKRGLPLHVDACFGGFLLPFLERMGLPLPLWDFRVPGVSSISADVHKYGYAPKGASVLLHRSMESLRHQFFVKAGWQGGIYLSPTMAGTRSGGAIAAAWTSLHALGEDGMLQLARGAWQTAEALRAGIARIDGLRLLGRPDTTVVTYASAPDGPDLYAVADLMQAKGWPMDRQAAPPSVHLSCNAVNAPQVPVYLADLAEAVAYARAHPELRKEGEAAVYGLMARIPVNGLVEREVLGVMEGMYAPEPSTAPLQPSKQSGIQGFVVDHLDDVTALVGKVKALPERARRALRR